MEDAHGVFDGCFGSHALYSLNDDLLSLLVGVQLGFVHNLIHITCRIKASLIFETLHQSQLGFFRRQSGEFFKLGLFLLLHLLEFLLLHCKQLLLVIHTLLALLHLLLATAELFLPLIEAYFPLLESVLILLYALVALLNFFLKFAFLIQKLLFDLKEFFLFDNFGLFIGRIHHLVIFSFYHITENRIADGSAYNKACHDRNYYTNHIIIVLNILCHLSASSISEVNFPRISL